MELLFWLFFFLICLYSCISWLASIPILSPVSSSKISQETIKNDWGTSYEEMIKLLPEHQNFSIHSFDGTLIKGKYFKSNKEAKSLIIGMHGWCGTWIDMLKYIPVLKDCSFDLILYDHRAHGASDKSHPTGGYNEAKDLLAITEWAEKNTGFKDQQIGWLGCSWGGSTALIAGATKRDIGFIIADAPFQNWYSAIFERAERTYGRWVKYLSISVMKIVDWRTGVNHREASPLLAAKKIKAPVLLFHSKTDLSTSAQQSINIFKNLNTQSEFHHLNWGGGHTLDVVLNKEKFQKIVNDFLKKIDGPFLK